MERTSLVGSIIELSRVRTKNRSITMQEELKSFVDYATAFEVGYAKNDWAVVDALLTDDIVWAVAGTKSKVGGAFEGRADVIEAIAYSTNTYDRRFQKRTPFSESQLVIPHGVYFPFTVTYTSEGLPPFVLHGEEWDLFRDGKLSMHYEILHNADALEAFIAEHEVKLEPRI
jgi:hypothetical protein